MEEQWISLNAFMKMRKIGYDTAIEMIENKEVESSKTPGGRYKIKIGGNTVSKEMYDQAIERAIQAETKLNVLKSILEKE
jgi:hypothetical protein|nr:MAG TPA: hypothetical protein [Caudoviricetes sp.]